MRLSWASALALLPRRRSRATVYPIDRAEFLRAPASTSRSSSPTGSPRTGQVTVNGADAAATFGKAASFIERADSRIIRILHGVLAKPGTYRIRASDSARRGGGHHDTGPRQAKA